MDHETREIKQKQNEMFGADATLIKRTDERMLDDFRIEWLCQRTCQILNVTRSIFVDMLERNNGVNEELIDSFFSTNGAFHERSYALIFHCENSTRDVWRMVEMIDEDDVEEMVEFVDDENDAQFICTVNEPIDAETEYPGEWTASNETRSYRSTFVLVDYIYNNARLSSGQTIDALYENLKSVQRLLVINQHDQKHYHFALESFHQARLYCEYRHYHNITTASTMKTFLYFIRTDSSAYLMQASTWEATCTILDEHCIYGIVPAEPPLVSLKDLLLSVYQHLLPTCHDRLQLEFYRFRQQIDSTLRQMQGEFHLTIPERILTNTSDETEEEHIENLEYLVYDWETILSKEMNNELNKRMFDSSPLAEMEFWHERSIRITSILEQMNKGLFLVARLVALTSSFVDDVMRIIHVLNELESPSLSGFENIKSQLHAYLVEATDNYKFLLTIERHLKTLQLAKSFALVIDMLPNLMQGLKTIW